MTSAHLSYTLSSPSSSALQMSQQAPLYLEKQLATEASMSVPLASVTESSNLWSNCEQLLLSCLRTGDDKSAHLCLEKLLNRFGPSNERIKGLQGLYQEAVAENSAALDQVLREYDNIILDDSANTPIMKRRATLLRVLARTGEAIGALVELLDMSPTDTEAWAELSDLYLSQAMYSQAIFCLEEVLLVIPGAWNMHARLGEILYVSTFSMNNKDAIESTLVDGVRHYCRSIELCDGFLRGYYGLKVSTDRLLETCLESGKVESRVDPDNSDRSCLPYTKIQKLNKKAAAEIAKVIRHRTAGGSCMMRYQELEVISARELLARDSSEPLN